MRRLATKVSAVCVGAGATCPSSTHSQPRRTLAPRKHPLHDLLARLLTVLERIRGLSMTTSDHPGDAATAAMNVPGDRASRRKSVRCIADSHTLGRRCTAKRAPTRETTNREVIAT